MAVVVRPMPMTVMTRTSLRPYLSPIGPRISAPKGRATKPTAKTARADSISATESPEGKNWAPMMAAN